VRPARVYNSDEQKTSGGDDEQPHGERVGPVHRTLLEVPCEDLALSGTERGGFTWLRDAIPGKDRPAVFTREGPGS
jgi:hypothetical protein